MHIEVDLENMSRLFRALRFRVFGDETKLRWTEQELLRFLADAASEACDDEYDGLLVLVSSQGLKEHVVTSNLKAISKAAIHRLFSVQCPELRLKPRLFVFDQCLLPLTRQLATQVKLAVDTAGVTADGTPHYEAPDVNHRLIEVHAESQSASAKMNEIDGSFLLHQIGSAIIANAALEKRQSLRQLLEGVNAERLRQGVAGSINIFHQNTRFVQLCKNKRRALKSESEHVAVDVVAAAEEKSNSLVVHGPLSPIPSTLQSLHVPVAIERVRARSLRRSLMGSNIGSTRSGTGTRRKERGVFVRKKRGKASQARPSYQSLPTQEVEVVEEAGEANSKERMCIIERTSKEKDKDTTTTTLKTRPSTTYETQTRKLGSDEEQELKANEQLTRNVVADTDSEADSESSLGMPLRCAPTPMSRRQSTQF